MNAPALADLTVEAERELLAILGEHFTAKQSETFAESSYRGGFRLVLADGQRSVEVLYSDMQLETIVQQLHDLQFLSAALDFPDEGMRPSQLGRELSLCHARTPPSAHAGDGRGVHVGAATGMVGDLQGIAGKGMEEIEGMDLCLTSS